MELRHAHIFVVVFNVMTYVKEDKTFIKLRIQDKRNILNEESQIRNKNVVKRLERKLVA